MTESPTLEPLADGSGFRVRVSYCGTRSRIRIHLTDRDAAAARAVELVAMGEVMTAAKQSVDLAEKFLQKAGTVDNEELARIKGAVAKLASGAIKATPKAENPRALWTMRELGEAWTDSKLAKEYSDQIKARRSSGDDVSRLEAHVYPVIGSLRVRDVTLDDLERVMRSMKGVRKATLSAGTRRHVALALNRLLSISVYPLRIRETNPIPRRGFLPQKREGKALAYLYPSEDQALMACAEIPIERRVFWGFLVREGCRVSEACALRWSDLDLERGAITLDKNKTHDPRAWALSPGVAAALKILRGRAPDGALVFEQPRDPHSNAKPSAPTSVRRESSGPSSSGRTRIAWRSEFTTFEPAS